MEIDEQKRYKNPPLAFAKAVTERAKAAWEDGSFMESVTPTTRALLTYWFDDAYVDMRDLNFHIGQRKYLKKIKSLTSITKSLRNFY